MVATRNRAALDKLKTILEDGQPRDVQYLVAHIEALIPTSEAVRDYFHMLSIRQDYKPDPSDPNIPYRSRSWRARKLIENLTKVSGHERIGKQVRKVPSSEELGR